MIFYDVDHMRSFAFYGDDYNELEKLSKWCRDSHVQYYLTKNPDSSESVIIRGKAFLKFGNLTNEKI